MNVIAGWYSKSAHQKITEAGGTAQNLKGEAFVFPKPKKRFVKREPAKKVKGGEEAPAATEGGAVAAAPAPAAALEAPAAE